MKLKLQEESQLQSQEFDLCATYHVSLIHFSLFCFFFFVNFISFVIVRGVSNTYFIKIKTFRLQTSNLLGNRRKTYILDVICCKFYFGEVQEEVLGQCRGSQGISAPRTECLSVCQWSVPEKNKQGG